MKKFFLNVNGETVGPYSVSDLRAMNIKPSTLVWYTGSVNWKKADSVPELQSLFSSDPFSVSDRPKQYNPPRSRSTSFSQFNFDPEPQAKNPAARVALVIGIVLVIVACGAGYYLEQKKQQIQQNLDDVQKIADSMSENQPIQDGEVVEDTSAVSPDVQDLSTLYGGEYDNLSGGIISITESDNELKIDLKYNMETGGKCKGEITGTGTPLNDSIISMTTSDGCNLTLNFRSRYTIAVEESGDCKNYHGKHCLFDGVYYGK